MTLNPTPIARWTTRTFSLKQGRRVGPRGGDSALPDLQIAIARIAKTRTFRLAYLD
jgi:hypothetical protein